MLKLDGQGTSCCYAMCTAGGHSSCDVVVKHYERLCAAAKALCDGVDTAEAEELAQALRTVINEETGLEG